MINIIFAQRYAIKVEVGACTMIKLLSEIEILELNWSTLVNVCKKELRRSAGNPLRSQYRFRTYTNTCNAYLLMPMNTLSYYIYDRSIYTLKTLV